MTPRIVPPNMAATTIPVLAPELRSSITGIEGGSTVDVDDVDDVNVDIAVISSRVYRLSREVGMALVSVLSGRVFGSRPEQKASCKHLVVNFRYVLSQRELSHPRSVLQHSDLY